MIAPIDAKVEFKAGGETITLRLNFRALSLLEDEGMDLFSAEGFKMTLARSAKMCRCLSINDHPDMDDDEALAIVARHGQAFGEAVLALIAKFGGESEEGNAKRAKASV